ncbi:MAG: flap endonuclease [Cellvibrionaceae bacterium]|nr:flap endonuclease [Cellvibrionaceae bacterium]
MNHSQQPHRAKPSPALLIDTSIYIFHYYFALPDHWFSEKEQWPTAAVYGYTAFLVRLLLAEQPQRIAACFDESLGSCFRNKIYPGYKASRALPDEALAFQLHACRQVTELLGISSFSSEHYEADDLLGSLYQPLKRSLTPIAILTRDKDLGQLLRRPQDFIWDYTHKQQLYPEAIEDKFGVMPEQLADYLALIGDAVDDIPGVPGIGPKTARQLLRHFGSLAAIMSGRSSIAQLPIRGAKSIEAKLSKYQQTLLMARQLTGLVTDVPLITRVRQLDWQPPQWPELAVFCQSMGFPKLYARISTLMDIL